MRVSGHWFWSRSAFPGWGSWCVCVCLGLACTPLLSGLGVGACGLVRAPRPFPATFWWGCLWRGGGPGLPRVGFAPPPPLSVFSSGCGGGCGFRPCRVVALWCPPLPVPVLGLLVSVPPSPFVWAAPLSFFFFFARHFSSGVCAGVSGCPFLVWAAAPGWALPGLAGLSSGVLLGGPVHVAFGVAWLGGWPASCVVGARLRGCVSVSCPPPLFFPFLFWGGGSCLFFPLPSLGWCKHWSAFDVANRVAGGACAWLGRAPAPWVGWVMYTLGLLAFRVGLGSGSAGWAVAPGGLVSSWVKGVGFSVSLRPCGAGLNFLVAACVGGPSPSLPGVRWPFAGVRRAGVALSHGCGRVSSPSGTCGGLLGLDPRLVSLALVLCCALVRRAVSCRGLPCCAVLVCAVLQCALVCRAVPCRVVPGCVVPWRGWLRRGEPSRAVSCYGVSCRGVPCRGALHSGALRCGVPCCLMLCRVPLCRGVRWALLLAVPARGGVGAGYTGPFCGAGRRPRLCGWLVAEGRG